MTRTRTRLALAGVIPAGVAFLFLSRHVGGLDDRDALDITLGVMFALCAIVGAVTGWVLSHRSDAAAVPAEVVGQAEVDAVPAPRKRWKVLPRDFGHRFYWAMVMAGVSWPLAACSASGVWAAIAATVALAVMVVGVSMASRLKGMTELGAMAAATALLLAAPWVTKAILADVEDEVYERSTIAGIQAHLDAARDYMEDGNRLYTFEFAADAPEAYMISGTVLRSGKSDQFVVGHMDPRTDGAYVLLSHRKHYELDLLADCPVVKPAARTVPTGEGGEGVLEAA